MINRWTLHVKNFGKIREAAIEVSPYMLFVGKNNSGKSYMMILLWGILNEARSLVFKFLKSHPKYDALHAKVVQTMLQQADSQVFVLEEEEQRVLLEVFNDILSSQKDYLVKKLFRHQVQIDSLSVERDDYSPLLFHIEEQASDYFSDDDGMDDLYHEFMVLWGDQVIHNALLLNPQKDTTAAFFLEFALTVLICEGYNDFRTRSQLSQPLYLPASRTGFMHTYRAIVGNVFESSISERMVVDENERKTAITGTELTLPTTLFLSKLQKQTVDEAQVSKYGDELQFIQQNVLRGTVVKDEFGEFKFTPQDTKANLPLHVTSSLVAEIAPISIFLASNYDPQLWIIEELESHLHTEMQLEMARLLFRLVNKGKAIWMTTHSDNLAQQINNLLTLSAHPRKEAIMKALNYDAKDLLPDPSIATAYQFEQVDGQTVVEKLELGENGFIIKTFNDTLGRLIEETNLIQNFTEDSV